MSDLAALAADLAEARRRGKSRVLTVTAGAHSVDP
jgi:hypothetical protein